MKFQKSLLIIPILLLSNMAFGQETIQQKFKKLDWLSGKWIRINAKKGESGYETWKKTSNVKLTGKGVTSRGNKTIFVENLEFIAKGTDLFYVVKVTGEKEPVYFKLTELTNNSFTCENPKHDFPKKIAYKRKDKGMEAVISGNGAQVLYDFVPAK